MSDNAAVKSDATATVCTVAADEVTYSGDTTKVQIARLVHVSGAEGSKTLTEICDTAGLFTHAQPATSGGCSVYHAVAAGSTNAANIKASAGQIYGISVFSLRQTVLFVKFHNTAGAPTAGVGVVLTVGVQAGLSRDLTFPSGLAFATGIAITMVTGIADNNAGAVSAEDCVVDVFYK